MNYKNELQKIVALIASKKIEYNEAWWKKKEDKELNKKQWEYLNLGKSSVMDELYENLSEEIKKEFNI